MKRPQYRRVSRSFGERGYRIVKATVGHQH